MTKTHDRSMINANNSKERISKKGIYQTIDAMLAGFLLLGALLLILTIQTSDKNSEQSVFVTQDVLNSLGELRIYELNNSFIAQEIVNGNITDVNKTVLEQIGIYWALNQSGKARTLIETMLNETLPEGKGIKITLGSQELLSKNSSTKTTVVTANRMISGVQEGKPLTGTSASAYLKKIHNKRTSTYAYFGGFVGQGNITTHITLPTDFNSSRLSNAELKLSTPGDFKVFINNIKCNGTVNGTFTGTGQINASTVSLWNVTSCKDAMVAGANNISIRFSSPLNISFIAGGFFKATYTTDTLKENDSDGYKRYSFPSIDGFINIYDAISAPGIIRNWTLNLTYYSIYDVFFTLGNETIFFDPGSNFTQSFTISRYNQTIPPSTIPLRMSLTNLSNISVLNYGQPADSFLVTDVSGSMGDCGTYINQTMCQYEYKGASWWWFWLTTSCVYTGSCTGNQCAVSPYYSSRNHAVVNQTVCSETLMDIAIDADKLFVDIILNASDLNKIGLVDFSSNANPPTNLTNIAGVLKSEIDTYSDGGGTCTCCGVNYARNLINSSSNKKFMIVLSDGEPTEYCSSYTDYTGSSGNNALSRSWAINASRLACQNNITVYAIGFGTAMSATGHDVMRQIACNSSLYYNATNTSQLAEIYKNISQQILVAANFSSQTVTIQGNFSETHLYDGYIDIYYDPLLTDTQNKISFMIETSQFNTCDPSISIPGNVEIQDAYITSYSGSHWTDLVTVNGGVIYNLSSYLTAYDLLGDPFIVQIPSAVLSPGAANSLHVQTADSPINASGCSDNNTLIYQVLINSSTTRTSSLEKAIGCKWVIESISGSFLNASVPSAYAGNNTCFYTNSTLQYNDADAYDVAVYAMLRQLDYTNERRIFVDLEATDMEIVLIKTGQIPYMWGPSLLRMDVWE